MYLDHSSIEEAAHKLLDICNKCPFDKLSSKYLKDTYTSPAWAEWLKRSVTLNDIPMQSCSAEEMKEIYNEIGKIPWEDSIKNFIFDTTSISTSRKFATCIVLSELNYEYQDATIYTIAGKYGSSDVTIIDVMPLDPKADGTIDQFKLRMRHNEISYEATVSSTALTSDLVQWYTPDSTLIFCHDNSIVEYQTSISMMPKSTWSISSTSVNYVVNKDTKIKCDYICPIFSFPGSLETRAVSSGVPLFTNNSPPSIYRGKLDYYSRCVRLSRHSSGKCYDCHKLLTTVRGMYSSPLSTPVVSSFVKFTPSFTKPLGSPFGKPGDSPISESQWSPINTTSSSNVRSNET